MRGHGHGHGHAPDRRGVSEANAVEGRILHASSQRDEARLLRPSTDLSALRALRSLRATGKKGTGTGMGPGLGLGLGPG